MHSCSVHFYFQGHIILAILNILTVYFRIIEHKIENTTKSKIIEGTDPSLSVATTGGDQSGGDR